MRFNDFSAGVLLTSFSLLLGCGTSTPGANPEKDAAAAPDSATGSGGAGSGGAGSGGAGSGGVIGSGDAGGSGGAAVVDAGAETAAMMPIPGTCQPPLDPDKPYDRLSQTGCMDASDVTKMAARVFAYEVNAPLWSDTAAKTRGMALPPGGKIHVKNCAGATAASLKMGDECCVVDPDNYPNCLPPADDGRWVLPIGTVLVKNFLFDSKLVETRLFVRQAVKKWIGYSYQWNEAQTDATIVPTDRSSVMFKTGMRTVAWNYPSRQDCMTCHNEGVGYFIGPETVQMNRVVAGMNQIDKMTAASMFETPPAKPYKAALVTPYAIPGQIAGPPAGTSAAELALSYLHANCSYCHRPDGTFYNIDFRHDTLLKNRGICNVMPMKGDIGVTGALEMIPGMPNQSVMVLRMNSIENKVRMPQVGTVVVDQQGTKLISDWITRLTAADCQM